MQESDVGVGVGMTASCLFVVSHAPQIYGLARRKRNTLSSHMVALQLMSGLLWIVYGVVEGAVSVLLFSSLSTVMRVAVLWFARGRAAGEGSRVTVLFGGGSLTTCHMYLRHVPFGASVCVVGDASTGDECDATMRRLRVRTRFVSTYRGTWSDLATARAVWICGGDTDRVVAALRPHSRALLACPLVGGTSAGAIAVARCGRANLCDVGVHGVRVRAGPSLSEDAAVCLVEDVVVEVAGDVRLAPCPSGSPVSHTLVRHTTSSPASPSPSSSRLPTRSPGSSSRRASGLPLRTRAAAAANTR